MAPVSLTWLTGARVILYGGVVCVIYAAILVAGILFQPGGPAVADFTAFQAAGRMALNGEGAAAYDWGRLRVVQAEVAGIPTDALPGYLGWLNPPHFLFAVMPFALLPYAWAWFAWALVSCIILALAVWTVMPRTAAVVAVMATPAILMSLSVGQNGLLIAALLAWILALIDRRPMVAGVALGLLTIKPQFGPLFPLILLLTGRWEVMASAAVTAILAAGAAWLVFGSEAWVGFFAFAFATDGSGRHLVAGGTTLSRIQSVYAAILQITGSEALAALAHGAFAMGAVTLVLRLWLRRPEGPLEARAAAAIAGVLMLTPYVWTYDTPALSVAALFLARAGCRDGFLRGEKALLVVACLWLAVSMVWQVSLIVPVAASIMLALAWRRDRAWRVSLARCAHHSAGKECAAATGPGRAP